MAPQCILLRVKLSYGQRLLGTWTFAGVTGAIVQNRVDAGCAFALLLCRGTAGGKGCLLHKMTWCKLSEQ